VAQRELKLQSGGTPMAFQQDHLRFVRLVFGGLAGNRMNPQYKSESAGVMNASRRSIGGRQI
jgi:hypothetical protein